MTNTGSDGISNKAGPGAIDAEDIYDTITHDPPRDEETFISASDDTLDIGFDIERSDQKHKIALVWLTNPSNKNIAGNPDAESDLDLDLTVYDDTGSQVAGCVLWRVRTRLGTHHVHQQRGRNVHRRGHQPDGKRQKRRDRSR